MASVDNIQFLAHLAKGNVSFCHHLASVVRHLSSVNFSHQVSDAGSGEPLVLFPEYDFDLVIYYSMMLTELTCTLYIAICT